MCEKAYHNRIDKCMNNIIRFLNENGINTFACCCGHGKYPITIVCGYGISKLEIFSGKFIFRKKKFYKKDRQGYYYIPESIKIK